MKTNWTSIFLSKALKSRKVRLIIDFGIITLIGLAIFRNFLFSSCWPAGGDILGWISRAYLFGHDFRWAYTWRPHSFGFPENIYIVDLFYMILHFFFGDPVFMIKLVMFLSFIFAGFSAYIFAFKYTRNNLASLSAALVYTLNQWVASQLTEAHLAILISYAVFPLIFLVFDKALETGKIKHSLLLSLCLAFLLTGFHLECVVIYGTALILFLIVYLFYPSSKETFSLRIKKASKVMIISVTATFLLSAFFTIPFISSINAPYFSAEYTYFIEDCYHISYKNVTDAFVLRAVENWGYVNLIPNVYYDLTLRNFPIYTLLSFIFSLAILVTLIFRLNRYAVFFAIAAFISIIIAMGPYSYFGEIFIWAWFNVPHFAVFRAASRWIVIAALAHSYFVSNLLSLLSDYLSENKSSTTSHNSQTRKNKEIKKKHSLKSSNLLSASGSLNVKKIRNFFRVISIFLMLIVFVSGFISCAFLFGSGLQVFSLLKSYVAPYYWVSNESGEFKIVTVNNSPGEWLGLEAETDFAFSGMLTEVGWWHDIGSDSSFIHDKPVLQNGGWDFHSRWFVDFLRFKVAREELTDHLFEVLGTFNYKYIVVPRYASEKIRTFFINQEGGEIAYNCSNSLILTNKFYTPRFFAAENYSVVVGGLESFLSLAKIDDFNFTENALFFADRNYKLLEGNLFRNSGSLIFVNSDPLELVMLTMKDSIIDASDYGFKSLNYTKYWVKWPSWRTVGSFVYWGDTLTTNGVNTVKIPFKVERDGNYTIWMRLGFAPSRGKLTVTVDDLFQTEIKPEAKFWSEPEWINLTNLNLRKGDHIITIRNDGKGYNDIDSIAIIETSKFQEQKSKILKAIKESETPIVYLLEAEINFLEDPCSKWNYKKHPYNDYLIYPEETATEKTKLYIPREGSYQFFARVLKGPECRVLRLLVDDKVLNASCYAENQGFEWLNLGSVYLSQGAHEIGVCAEGYVELDLIAVASTKNGKQLNSLGELFQGSFEKPTVNFEKLNPCEYRVHVKTEEPFILVFSDAYHPLWRAILDDGTEVKPVNFYHIVNGFFINRTGEFNLTVRFIGQDYVDLGFKISLVTFILVLGLLAIPERIYLRVRRWLASLKRAIYRRF